MELLINKDTVNVCETVYDGCIEQGVEFDYVLPDYYPDIFRIIKCSLTPGIVSYNFAGDQLVCDGGVYIRVLYTGEENNKINCIEHRYTYSKTIDLSAAPEMPAVVFLPKTDYCNCRAISGRRLDVRGAVSIRTKITNCVKKEIITDVCGGGIEKRTEKSSYCVDRLYASRRFVSREDIETGTGKGGISCILSNSCTVSPAEVKIVAEKAVVKAEVTLKAIYLVQTDDGENMTESMEASIPLSQIIDVAGLTPEHTANAVMRILDCDIEAKNDENGENRIIACDLTVDCCVYACADGEISPVTDLYSTEYETDFRQTEIKAEHSPQKICEQTAVKLEIDCGGEGVEEIKDARCEVTGFSCAVDEDDNEKLKISGQCAVQLICANGNMLYFIDRSESFSAEVGIIPVCGGSSAEIDVSVSSVSYSISSDNAVDMRIQLLVCGTVYSVGSVKTVDDISVHEDMKKCVGGDYSLKLYYADAHEDIWSIAKHYNTSVELIEAENELDGEVLAEPCMLLIPIS